MFEHRSQPLLPNHQFVRRLFSAFGITVAIVIGSISLGTMGYHWLAGMSWDYAFHHSCLMLSGHDVTPIDCTLGGHIFSGIFVLYARLVFVSMAAIMIVPVMHRVFHKLHLDVKTGDAGSK